MKKLFQAIRKSDIETVKELLEKKPDLISCTAKQPPKKDDGQSPLQVALKTDNLEIAEYLLDMNADVNFMESEDCCNEWRMPVIHDAVNAAIMNTRWNVNSEIMYGGVKVFHSKDEANRAYKILKRMIDMGADVNSADSYGNTCVWRACLQARQILPTYNHQKQELGTDRLLTPELTEDLQKIFTLLYENGMDIDYIKQNVNMSAKDYYRNEPVAQFLQFDRQSKQ